MRYLNISMSKEFFDKINKKSFISDDENQLYKQIPFHVMPAVCLFQLFLIIWNESYCFSHECLKDLTKILWVCSCIYCIIMFSNCRKICSYFSSSFLKTFLLVGVQKHNFVFSVIPTIRKHWNYKSSHFVKPNIAYFLAL